MNKYVFNNNNRIKTPVSPLPKPTLDIPEATNIEIENKTALNHSSDPVTESTIISKETTEFKGVANPNPTTNLPSMKDYRDSSGLIPRPLPWYSSSSGTQPVEMPYRLPNTLSMTHRPVINQMPQAATHNSSIENNMNYGPSSETQKMNQSANDGRDANSTSLPYRFSPREQIAPGLYHSPMTHLYKNKSSSQQPYPHSQSGQLTDSVCIEYDPNHETRHHKVTSLQSSQHEAAEDDDNEYEYFPIVKTKDGSLYVGEPVKRPSDLSSEQYSHAISQNPMTKKNSSGSYMVDSSGNYLTGSGIQASIFPRLDMPRATAPSTAQTSKGTASYSVCRAAAPSTSFPSSSSSSLPASMAAPVSSLFVPGPSSMSSQTMPPTVATSAATQEPSRSSMMIDSFVNYHNQAKGNTSDNHQETHSQSDSHDGDGDSQSAGDSQEEASDSTEEEEDSELAKLLLATQQVAAYEKQNEAPSRQSSSRTGQYPLGSEDMHSLAAAMTRRDQQYKHESGLHGYHDDLSNDDEREVKLSKAAMDRRRYVSFLLLFVIILHTSFYMCLRNRLSNYMHI